MLKGINFNTLHVHTDIRRHRKDTFVFIFVRFTVLPLGLY